MKQPYQIAIFFTCVVIIIGVGTSFWSKHNQETINEKSFRTFVYCSQVIKVKGEDSKALCRGYYAGLNQAMSWVDQAATSSSFANKFIRQVNMEKIHFEKGCSSNLEKDTIYFNKQMNKYSDIQFDQADNVDPLVEIYALNLIQKKSKKCRLNSREES